MPKPVKDTKFIELEGSLEELIPKLYSSRKIVVGIDNKADTIVRTKNEVDGSISYKIPKRAPAVNVRIRPLNNDPDGRKLIKTETRPGMLIDNKKRIVKKVEQRIDTYAYENEVLFEPAADKTRRFFLFPDSNNGVDENKIALEDRPAIKPYVVELREDGKVYISEDTVEDYETLFDRQQMLSSYERQKNRQRDPQPNGLPEDLERRNVKMTGPSSSDLLTGNFDVNSIVRINNRNGDVIHDPAVEGKNLTQKKMLDETMDALENGYSSVYITTREKDGTEKVHLVEKYHGKYMKYNQTFDKIPEDHNSSLWGDEPEFELMTKHLIPKKRAVLESQIRNVNDAVFLSADGKVLSREEADAELVKDNSRMVVYPPDGSRPRWVENKNGKLCMSGPMNEKISFKDEDFTELGEFGDPNTAGKLKLSDGAYARDGEGNVFRMAETGDKNVIHEENELQNRMLDQVSPGKNRLLVFDKPGSKPRLLESRTEPAPSGPKADPSKRVNVPGSVLENIVLQPEDSRKPEVMPEDLARQRAEEEQRRSKGIIRLSKPLDVSFDYNEKDIKDIETEYYLKNVMDGYISPDDLSFALDADGKIYKNMDEITAELSKKDSMLFLYNKDGDLPYAVQNKDGKISISDKPISAQNQLPDSNFSAKPSLNPAEIIKIPSKVEYQIAKDKLKTLKYWDKQEVGPDESIRKEKERIESHKKKEPQRPTEPTKPTFSVGSKFWRGVVKVFTLGQGETAAYKKYQDDLVRYQEEEIPAFTEKLDKWEEEHKAWKDKLELHKGNIQYYKDIKEQLTTVKPGLQSEVNNKLNQWKKEAAGNASALSDYRKNPEVFAEGVSDFLKNGVTPNNLFAYTKMAKASCDEMSPDDPDAMTELTNYVAAEMAQELIDKNMFDDSIAENPALNRLCDRINDGSAREEIANDPDFKEIMKQNGDRPINPHSISYAYINKVRDRGDYDYTGEKADKHIKAVRRLEENRKQLVDNFGRQPLSKDSLKDIMRLTVYDHEIYMQRDNGRLGIREAGKKIADLNSKDLANTQTVKDSGKFGPNASKIVEAMMENEKVWLKNEEEMENSLRNKSRQLGDRYRSLNEAGSQRRYDIKIEEMSEDDPRYDPNKATIVTKSPIGEKAEQLKPNDKRIDDFHLEPGRSYVVTKTPVYTLEEMKEMYANFQQKLEAPQQAQQPGAPQL